MIEHKRNNKKVYEMVKLHEMHAGDWVSDSDAAVRCSDCYLFPAAEECGQMTLILDSIHFNDDCH